LIRICLPTAALHRGPGGGTEAGRDLVHAQPGPLSREEDAVYQFVTMVARGYLGRQVWSPEAKAPAAS